MRVGVDGGCVAASYPILHALILFFIFLAYS